MPSLRKHKTLFFLLVCIIFTFSNGQVTFTDLPQLRMGQQSIFDNAYFPLNQNSQVDVTYKTAFTVAATPIVHQAVVFSGFENYLHYEICFNVTLQSVYYDRITVNIYVGSQTYIKQMNINYFIMQSGGSRDAFIKISIGNYRTLNLDDPAGSRTQTFNNQTTSFTNVKSFCSAIHGIDFINNDGVLSEVNVNTVFISNPLPALSIIQQQVIVGEKGKLNYISLTTILVDAGFYPPTYSYGVLAEVLQTTVTDTSGLTELQAISNGGLFASTQNSMFFGIRGFKFKMQENRVFLLKISTQTDFRTNLQTNIFMQETELSIFLMVGRTCPAGQFYYVQGFACLPNSAACTANPPLLLVSSGISVCRNCHEVCQGCTGDVGNCQDCVPGNNRVPTHTPPYPNCVCDTGYIEVNSDSVCQKCSDLIQGCVTCTSPTSCSNCGDPTVYESYLVETDNKCRCKDAKFLVTGRCLSYPGCKTANIYITGEFCQTCDEDNNFQKDLANSSSCVCKTAYFLNANNLCEDRCGDGITPESPANATDTQKICDDNNTISGDGCSSTCRQEFGYNCSVVVGGISKCAQIQTISIVYLYSEKNLVGNQGVIVFALLPKQHFLPESSFQSLVSMNITGSTTIKFDPVNSLILITVNYPSTLEDNEYQFTFSFTGLSIYSADIPVTVTLNGINAKLETSQSPQQVNIITYVTLGVAAFALALALMSSFLGQKLLGIQLILPIQAAFFTMSTLPKNVLSPISALWSLKFSNGYNSLEKYDLKTNYMLDPRLAVMQYTGQYILNYNIMFLLLALVIVIIGIIALRIAWLQREQKRLEDIQKKKEEEDKNEPKKKKKTKSQNQKDDEKQTEDESKKDEQIDLQSLEEELQDTRENMKNWKNFMYMIFDRFFSILIVTAMMKVIFCFYIQLSNLTYTTEVYDNSLNAGFFFLTYATIITGLYAIIYDYKTDKLILFTCNKGKYAMFYITIFLVYIIVLGAIFETTIAVYISAIFALLPIILIIYQVPYGLRVFDFQTIIAVICQLPFLGMSVVSLMLNMQKDTVKESTCMMFAYAIVGSSGLSIILTIVRLIKIIDCKKVSCVQFTDRKKENANDKNKKKRKVALLVNDGDKDFDEEGSVRAVLYERNKNQENQDLDLQGQGKDEFDSGAKKNETNNKEKDKPADDEDDDQQIDELEKIKMKLRKQLKQKKAIGKIK